MVKDYSDKIQDEDKLYRRVPADRNLYHYENGKVFFHSPAFGDRSKEPSLDRAKLRNNDPSLSRQKNSDGIVSVIAKEVRSEPVTVVHGGKEQTIYNIHVIADPIHEPLAERNLAHAVIVPSPEYKSNKAFEKVLLRLSILASSAGWTLPPEE